MALEGADPFRRQQRACERGSFDVCPWSRSVRILFGASFGVAWTTGRPIIFYVSYAR